MSDRKLINAAIVQHPPVFLNLDESINKAIKLIEEASQYGADIIAFPETWLPGYPVWIDSAPKAAMWDYPPAKALFKILFENSIQLPSYQLNKLLSSAKQNEVYIVMGANERDGGTLYNAIIYIDKNGEDYKIHRKLIPTYTERMMWGRGDGSTLNVLDTEFGTVGGLVCWEHWMPFARAAIHAKNELIHIAQWPGAKELHQLASRHYAFEGQCFVLAAGTHITKGNVLEGFDSLNPKDKPARELLENIEGDNTKILYNGGSSIIAPDASYIVEPQENKSEIIYGELNPELVYEGRLTLDTNGHYSRPDVFTLNINTDKQENVYLKSKE